MNVWTEQNFLERLVPQLRQDKRIKTESCPDAELLTSFTDDQVAPFVRQAISAHLEHCTQCSELCLRLTNFNETIAPAQDTEWVNVEKRLNNWMEGLLDSHSEGKSNAPAANVLVLQGDELPGARIWWRFSRAMAAAAALVLIVGGIFLTKRVWLLSPAQIATTQPPASAPNPTPLPTIQAPVAEPAPAQPSGSEAPAKSATANTAGLTAQATPRNRPLPKTAPTSAPNAPGDDQSTQSAQFTPPEVSPNDRIVAGSAGMSAPSQPAAVERAADMPSDHLPKPALAAQMPSRVSAWHGLAKVGSGPAALAPSVPFFQLDAGTRIWVRLVNTLQQTDGNFNFTGSLLQPVTLNGIVLAQGTGVTGRGTEFNGSVTLWLHSFLIQGWTYAVRGESKVQGQPAPGTVSTVQFQDGQVLEMWLSSNSVFDKLPSSAGSGISLGMTRDEVERALGKPATITDLGARQIYFYKDLKVTFLEGKVSEVQ